MKYGMLFRKIVLDGISYYQMIDKVMGEVIDGSDTIKIIKNERYNDYYISSISNTEDEICYLEISENSYQTLETGDTCYIKKVDDNFIDIDNPIEKYNVILAFYDEYKDFKLMPSLDIDNMIENLSSLLKTNLIGQDDVIKKIITKIYNNQMLIDSDLDNLYIKNNKQNILLMGPFGTGKTTIKNILKESRIDIPVVEHKLIGSYKEDMSLIINKLVAASGGNLFLASRGIVIFDGIDSMSSKFEETDTGAINLYIDTLEKILASDYIGYNTNEGMRTVLDYSHVTNICMIDMDYTEELEDDTFFYSKVSLEDLSLLGITSNMLYDYFGDEIIYMNEMTPSLMHIILKNEKISPLYKIKKMLESKGKKVIIETNFIETLVNTAIDFEEGFGAVIKLLNYILETKNLKNKTIRFKASDFNDLKIGTGLQEEDEFQNENTIVTSGNLKIDLKNRTINGLTKLETVNLIKEDIKGQDNQIFRIVNAFYNHHLEKNKGFSLNEFKNIKSNVLIIGPTGVGKTSIVEKLSYIFKIPFVREDATTYSPTGIVGADVNTMIKDLVDVAGGDKEKASNGIIYIDEIDKLASNRSNVDIGKNVQQALLTLVEGNKVTISPPQTFQFKEFSFDTTGVLFIASGAFEGIKEIISSRVKKEKSSGKAGFTTNTSTKEINYTVTTKDLEQYGMLVQLLGRFPEVVVLNELNEEITLLIIDDSKSGYVNLKIKSYKKEDIDLELTEEFKKELAKASYLDKKGARSIRTIFSKILSDVDLKLMEDDYEKVILNEGSIKDSSKITYVKRLKK